MEDPDYEAKEQSERNEMAADDLRSWIVSKEKEALYYSNIPKGIIDEYQRGYYAGWIHLLDELKSKI